MILKIIEYFVQIHKNTEFQVEWIKSCEGSDVIPFLFYLTYSNVLEDIKKQQNCDRKNKEIKRKKRLKTTMEDVERKYQLPSNTHLYKSNEETNGIIVR